MLKSFKYFLIGWIVALGVFNAISFAIPLVHTSTFWVGYAFITLAIVCQAPCGYYVFKEKNVKKVFYTLPIVRIMYIGLIVTLVLCSIVMAINVIPYWVGIIVGFVILLVEVFALIKAKTAASVVGGIDDRIENSTLFVRAATSRAEYIMSKAQSDSVKAECKKVYESLRYSDPVSTEELKPIEASIASAMDDLDKSVEANDLDATDAISLKITNLTAERNRLCKISKQ